MRFSGVHIMTILASAAGAFLSAQAAFEFIADGSVWWLSSLWVIIALAFAGTCGLLCLRSERACRLSLATLILLATSVGVGAIDLLGLLATPEEAGPAPQMLLVLLPLFLPVAIWAYVTRDIFRLRRKGELS
jgi:hypothetical protein